MHANISGFPKISVVTPSFDQAQYIEQTIVSVLRQNYPNFEHIIIDGGSADSTIEILRKYPHLKWLSEKDNGQSDALNKGFRMASGDIIAWINSDDWYEPGVFEVIAAYFKTYPERNIVMGDCNLIDENGNIFDKVINHERGFDELKKHWVPRSIPTQPAIFFRRQLIDEYGYLDETLHFAMDYDLWMRFAQQNRFYHLDRAVANYRFHSSAKGGDQDWNKFLPDCVRVYNRYCMPIVSVIIPCYNYACYLSEAVESVINQTYQDFEIIIVNDGSTDNTIEVAELLIYRFPQYRIRLINQPNSGHPAFSRNKGISGAVGEYILPLDADDMIASTMLEKCVDVLSHDASLSIVYTDRLDFGSVNQIIAARDYDFELLKYQNHLSYCAMFKKAVWEAVGGYKPIGCEDWNFWIEAGALGRFAKRIPQALFLYRRHDAGRFQHDSANIERVTAKIILQNRKLYTDDDVRQATDILDASKHLVSVIMPTYNRPEMLRTAIQSVLNQTFQDFEIIVVNDAGEDANFVIKAFNSPKISYIRHETNKGLAAARNSGILAARGKYIAYLDDDDIFYPEHLATLVQRLESDGSFVAYTDAHRVHLEERDGITTVVGRDLPYSMDFDYQRILFENFIPVLCVMHRRECLEQVGGFDPLLHRLEDWDLWIRMSRHYQFHHVPTVTCAFTWRTVGGATMTSANWEAFDWARLRVSHKCRPLLPHIPAAEAWHAEFAATASERLAAALELALTARRYAPRALFGTDDMDEVRSCARQLSEQHPEHRVQMTRLLELIESYAYLAPKSGSAMLLGGGGKESGPKPLVSVIVPTHNRPGMLKDTVQSVLDQTFQDFEIIVINDAGQDVSSVVQAFNSPKISYLSHETNKGLAAARNTGIRAARGKYLAYLDDDDIYYVNHLEVLVTFLESTNFNVAYTDSYRAIQESHNGVYATTKRETLYSFDFDYDKILIENFIPVLCIMHRRKCLEKSGYFDETLDRHEDWDLWIRMSRHYKFAHIPEITCEFTYRSDGSAMTSGSLPKFLTTLQRVYQKYELEVPTDNVIRQQKQKSLFDVCCSVFHFIGERLNTLLPIDELPYQALSMTGATVSQVRSSYYWKKGKQCTDLKEAITFLEKAVIEDADNHPAKVDLVSKFIEVGRFIDAVSILTKLEELNPLQTIFSITRKNLEEKCDQTRAPASCIRFDRDTPDTSCSATVNVKNHAVKCSIIIPLYNQVELTQACLNAIARNTPSGSYELFLVDNGSSDGTARLLDQWKNKATIIRNVQNLGFSKACNQGARAANSKYLLFLNNDTEPQPGWLEPLLNTAEQDAGIAAVGSKLLFPDGTIQHAGVVIADNRVTPDPLVGKHIYYGFPADDSSANVTRRYQALTAACLLVRRDAFETVQGFDEGYWNGYENVDLCFKLGLRGWKLIYQPASVVVHHESKSGGERFAKAAQNIQRLHEKWLGTIQPDVIIHSDSRVEWLEGGASVATEAEPLVSIIIPLFNQAQLTKACVEAIQATTGDHSRYELILVDNGSYDWTPEYLRSLGNSVIVIANQENLGFAKACNQGAQIAKGEYLLFLNNDTVPQPGWLDALLSGAREEGADIVGAKLLYPNGRVQHAGVTFNRNGIGYHIFKNFDANTPAVNKKRFMQCVTAACMLISKQLFNDLDGFDEQFRNGFEDVDFCLRAGQAGKRILYTPDAVVIHHEEQSEGRKQHDYENMQLYLTRWLGRVRCDDEELYAAEGLSIEWHADGTCVVRPRSAQKAIHENCRYPLIPLVGRSSSSILQKLSSSQRTKGVLKRYTAEV